MQDDEFYNMLDEFFSTLEDVEETELFEALKEEVEVRIGE